MGSSDDEWRAESIKQGENADGSTSREYMGWTYERSGGQERARELFTHGVHETTPLERAIAAYSSAESESVVNPAFFTPGDDAGDEDVYEFMGFTAGNSFYVVAEDTGDGWTAPQSDYQEQREEFAAERGLTLKTLDDDLMAELDEISDRTLPRPSIWNDLEESY